MPAEFHRLRVCTHGSGNPGEISQDRVHPRVFCGRDRATRCLSANQRAGSGGGCGAGSPGPARGRTRGSQKNRARSRVLVRLRWISGGSALVVFDSCSRWRMTWAALDQQRALWEPTAGPSRPGFPGKPPRPPGGSSPEGTPRRNPLRGKVAIVPIDDHDWIIRRPVNRGG